MTEAAELVDLIEMERVLAPCTVISPRTAKFPLFETESNSVLASSVSNSWPRDPLVMRLKTSSPVARTNLAFWLTPDLTCMLALALLPDCTVSDVVSFKDWSVALLEPEVFPTSKSPRTITSPLPLATVISVSAVLLSTSDKIWS